MIGEQYHLLPSQVAEQATIFDIMAMDIKRSWDDYQRATPEQRAQMMFNKMNPDDLQKMVKDFRNG
jgi:hypothetical protein